MLCESDVWWIRCWLNVQNAISEALFLWSLCCCCCLLIHQVKWTELSFAWFCIFIFPLEGKFCHALWKWWLRCWLKCSKFNIWSSFVLQPLLLFLWIWLLISSSQINLVDLCLVLHIYFLIKGKFCLALWKWWIRSCLIRCWVNFQCSIIEVLFFCSLFSLTKSNELY